MYSYVDWFQHTRVSTCVQIHERRKESAKEVFYCDLFTCINLAVNVQLFRILYTQCRRTTAA